MRLLLTAFVTVLVSVVHVTEAVETISTRRVHRHKHARVDKEKPLESLSQLLARSAALTKAFEKETEVLHEKVQETEESDVSSDAAEPAVSFVEIDSSRHHRPAPGSGLRAMEAVTDEIMRFTDKMRKMGNDVSLFASR